MLIEIVTKNTRLFLQNISLAASFITEAGIMETLCNPE